MDRRLGFVGLGQMATALAKGFLTAGKVSSDRLFGFDPFVEARERFIHEVGGLATEDNSWTVRESEVVFLAVKPQTIDRVLAEIADAVDNRHLIVSIAAGVPIARLEAGLSGKGRVVRVMPNTPCLVGESASGFSLGSAATREDAETVADLLGAVGEGIEVPEDLLDAVTGLSGSGPAYVYLVIEALSDGGVRAGLPRSVATRLAARTVLGGAKMVLETGRHPGELKDMVTSPGGTTIEGVATLESLGLRASLIEAVTAATRRAKELGRD